MSDTLAPRELTLSSALLIYSFYNRIDNLHETANATFVLDDVVYMLVYRSAVTLLDTSFLHQSNVLHRAILVARSTEMSSFVGLS